MVKTYECPDLETYGLGEDAPLENFPLFLFVFILFIFTIALCFLLLFLFFLLSHLRQCYFTFRHLYQMWPAVPIHRTAHRPNVFLLLSREELTQN